VQIDTSSATLAIGSAGALQNANVAGKSVWFHLTKGFTAGKGPTSSALTFTSTVKVQSTAAEAGQWRFAHIQVMKLEEYEAVYVGRTPGDGEARLKISSPMLLDSEPKIMPWTSSGRGSFKSSGAMESSFGDHPSSKAAINLVNRLTASVLYLRRFVDRRTVFTAFVAEDPGGQQQVLCHRMWLLNYGYRLKWKGSGMVVELDNSLFVKGKVHSGAPAEAAARNAIQKGQPPLYNQQTRSQLIQAVGSGPPKRTDVDFRQEPNVPKDFVT